MMIYMKIDSREVEVPEGTTLLQACEEAGVKIPTLCYHPMLKPYGACRICQVEVKTARGGPSRLITSCITAVEKGMEVRTDSERVREARRFIIGLLLAKAPESDVLKKMAEECDIDPEADADDDIAEYFKNYVNSRLSDGIEPPAKCIMCGSCVRVCAEITGRRAISFADRGQKRRIKTPYDKVSEPCIGCKACAYICPTNAVKVEEAE